jgi:hypothetical protein
LETWHTMKCAYSFPNVLENDKEKFDLIKGEIATKIKASHQEVFFLDLIKAEIVKKFKATHHEALMLDAGEMSGTGTDTLDKSDKQDIPQIPIFNNIPQISGAAKFQNHPPVPEPIDKKPSLEEIKKIDKPPKDEKNHNQGQPPVPEATKKISDDKIKKSDQNSQDKENDLNNQPSPQPSIPKPDSAVEQITADPKKKFSSEKPDNDTDTLKSQTKKSSTDPFKENETELSDTDDLPQKPNNFKRNIFITSLILLVLAAIAIASALFIRFKRSQSELLNRYIFYKK